MGGAKGGGYAPFGVGSLALGFEGLGFRVWGSGWRPRKNRATAGRDGCSLNDRMFSLSGSLFIWEV